ncbi:hypothetical protein SAMN05216353_11618 [Halobacillus alkaliphilus]|uniref:Uncharacterized protein n=1 Tax=Halobacillus alkaliphilus TaxID=396056 RepID=A0A1I2N022_9BACI|nr:hypothetical protein [Halobacillus alkaliphilus]SFF96219.1 hypothetical protein SAMN05216353_11618 [Halobacillus alkaliphilus]
MCVLVALAVSVVLAVAVAEAVAVVRVALVVVAVQVVQDVHVVPAAVVADVKFSTFIYTFFLPLQKSSAGVLLLMKSYETKGST